VGNGAVDTWRSKTGRAGALRDSLRLPSTIIPHSSKALQRWAELSAVNGKEAIGYDRLNESFGSRERDNRFRSDLFDHRFGGVI